AARGECCRLRYDLLRKLATVGHSTENVMPADAIKAYHDLLTDALAADTQAELAAQTRRHDMQFGSRPVFSVVRPRFLSAMQYRLLRSRVQTLLPAFRKIYAEALANVSFRAQFRLLLEEDTLLSFDPGIPDPSPTARLDSFFVSELALKFTEYNAETP